MVLVLTGFFTFGSNIRFCLENTNNRRPFSIAINDTSAKALKKAANKEARKAMLMSTILPGAGQVYNRKYWKVPTIYALGAGMGYLFIQTNSEYQRYHKILYDRYHGNPNSNPGLTDDDLIAYKAQYGKYRTLSAIGIGLVYLINILDANIDGHMKNFNAKINDDVTLRIKPYNTVTLGSSFQSYNGLTLQLNIR